MTFRCQVGIGVNSPPLCANHSGASCSSDSRQSATRRGYPGRLDTVWPEALRLILVKADGAVLLRPDAGGCKPPNSDWTLDRP